MVCVSRVAAFIRAGGDIDDGALQRSRVHADASWTLKLRAHAAHTSGDLFTAYHMLLRYQLMRGDTQVRNGLWRGGLHDERCCECLVSSHTIDV